MEGTFLLCVRSVTAGVAGVPEFLVRCEQISLIVQLCPQLMCKGSRAVAGAGARHHGPWKVPKCWSFTMCIVTSGGHILVTIALDAQDIFISKNEFMLCLSSG